MLQLARARLDHAAAAGPGRPGRAGPAPRSRGPGRARATRLRSGHRSRTAVPSACSEERMRSTSTLNQRSTVCWMRSLPDDHEQERGRRRHQRGRRSRAACGSARPSTPRRRSMITRTRLRPSTSSRTSRSADVEDGQAVEEDGGEEVGREVAALAQEDLHEDEQRRARRRSQSRTRGALLRNGVRGTVRGITGGTSAGVRCCDGFWHPFAMAAPRRAPDGRPS